MKSIVSCRVESGLQVVLLCLLYFYSTGVADGFLLQARGVSRATVVGAGSKASPSAPQQQAAPLRAPQGPIALVHHRVLAHQSRRLVSMCQLPEQVLAAGKCGQMHEPELNQSSLNEFQLRLVESSQDVVHLLRSYRDEFRSLTVDLVWSARQNTLNRLHQLSSSPFTNPQTRPHYEWAVRRLYESIYLHLPAAVSQFNQLELSDSSQYSSSMSSGALIEREINTFFRRLQLIQVKRLLDQSLPNSLDLECLEANLQSDKQIEQALSESINQLLAHQSAGGQVAPPSDAAMEQLKPQLTLDRLRISLSIKQSLEFARTLLSSLNLATELFHNLTSQPADWMSQGSCHQALARMTVCQQCQQPASSGPEQPQEQQVAPCEPYCLNVVRGCINDVYELNSFWAQHVNSLTRFKMNMIQTNNIENVMSSLDEKLISFMERLHQQYTGLISSHNQSATTGHWLLAATGQHQTTISAKMARQCQSRQPGGQSSRDARPASRVLPATQRHLWAAGNAPAGWQHGHLAHRARQSAAHSLFNRLDTFVHELAGSRDFFAEWPERLCRRMRRPSAQQPAGAGQCWNGRDFAGYTKPLVEFGKPLTGAHPEVPVSEPVAVNPIVLNLVAKLKLVGAQLARKSVRVPSLYEALPALVSGSTVLEPGLASSVPVSAALAAGQLDPNASLMESAAAAAAAVGGEQAGADTSGSMNALAAAAVAVAASSSNPSGGVAALDEAPEERAEEAEEGKAELAGQEGDEENDEAQGDGAGGEEEEAEEEEEGEVNCTQTDCSDLLNNVALSNGTTEQQVPVLDMDTNNSGAEPTLDNTPSIIVIPKPSEKLNPIYPYPMLPNGQLNLPANNQQHNNHNHHHHHHHPHNSNQHHLNTASTASTQNTLVINLLLAMALGILLASLVCLRRLKLRL